VVNRQALLLADRLEDDGRPYKESAEVVFVLSLAVLVGGLVAAKDTHLPYDVRVVAGLGGAGLGFDGMIGVVPYLVQGDPHEQQAARVRAGGTAGESLAAIAAEDPDLEASGHERMVWGAVLTSVGVGAAAACVARPSVFTYLVALVTLPIGVDAFAMGSSEASAGATIRVAAAPTVMPNGSLGGAIGMGGVF
jgi:hypothetical protein